MVTSARQVQRHSTVIYILGLICAAVVCGGPATARAQCVGDCDGDGKVSITELIIGVNIALGAQPASACRPFQDQSGAVSISQLIKGVNNALGSCPAVATPTATAVTMPTAVITPTATNAVGPSGTPTVATMPTPTCDPAAPAVCGDGCVENGEYCDDGNTIDDETCPSTCTITFCHSGATVVNVDVLIQAPAGTLGLLNLFLRYPESAVVLPASGPDAAADIINLPDDAFTPTVNDLEFGVTVSALGPGGLTLGDNNRFFTAQFRLCDGAQVPSASDFKCTMDDAELLDLDTGNQTNVTADTHCSVAVE